MDKIWLSQYQQGVPSDIDPACYQSLIALIKTACEQFADNPAFSSFGCLLTYRELEEQAALFAAYCQQVLKLKKGTRVALILPNLLQYPIALIGCLFAGLTVVNVNPLYTANEMAHQLQDSGAEMVVVFANRAHILEPILANTAIKHIIVTEIADQLPQPKRWLINSVVKYFKRLVPRYRIPQAIAWGTVLNHHHLLEPVTVVADDVAFLQYTGGTTGLAKGAMLTHRNLIANILQIYHWMIPSLEQEKEIIVTALPLYHIFSLTCNCLMFFLFGGLNVLIVDPRNVPAFVNDLKRYPWTVLTGVNTLFNHLLQHEAFTSLDFSSLKLVISGGMALHGSVAKAWKDTVGVPIIEGYGLTEASPVLAINPITNTHYNGSIGLPIPSTEIMICDDQGNEQAIGEAGELYVRGPQVMQGYWQCDEATRQVLSEAGWLATGDVAVIDEAGYLRIVDRKKDMIVVSGFNVYPTEVEAVIAKLDAVLDVAVIGIPHEATGEQVKAFIVKKEESLTEAAIIAQCRSELTAYKVPHSIEFREALPKTNVGKVLRRALRE